MDAAETLVERLRDRTGEVAARRLVPEMTDLRDRYGLDAFRVVSQASQVEGFGVPDTFWRLERSSWIWTGGTPALRLSRENTWPLALRPARTSGCLSVPLRMAFSGCLNDWARTRCQPWR